MNNGAIDKILELKRKIDIDDGNLVEALHSIPKKYADIVLNKYLELTIKARQEKLHG
jgi:hypothetical protein